MLPEPLKFKFSVKTEKHLTAFESSFVGHICGKHKKEDDTTVRKDLRLTMKDNEFYEIEKEIPPLKDSILRNNFEFLSFTTQTPLKNNYVCPQVYTLRDRIMVK